jgi:hypothetical protein
MIAMLPTGVDSSWVVMLPGVLLACLGSGVFNPAASALALSALPDRQSGLAAGANDTFRQTGVSLGIAALGTLVPSGAALGGDPQAYVTGFHNLLVVGGVVSILGAVVTGALLLGLRTPEPVAETA